MTIHEASERYHTPVSILRMLKQRRDKTPDKIHVQKRRLDRPDDLRHLMRKQEKLEKALDLKSTSSCKMN